MGGSFRGGAETIWVAVLRVGMILYLARKVHRDYIFARSSKTIQLKLLIVSCVKFR